MKKTYGMKGVSECVFRAPVGKATIVCVFTDGNLQSRVPVPASFSTENPIVQAVIESCELYANKKIFILSTSGEEEPVIESTKVETKKAKKAGVKQTKVFADVKTFGDAVTTLMSEGEVAASDLTSLDGVLRKSAELGISFPNLKA